LERGDWGRTFLFTKRFSPKVLILPCICRGKKDIFLDFPHAE